MEDSTWHDVVVGGEEFDEDDEDGEEIDWGSYRHKFDWSAFALPKMTNLGKPTRLQVIDIEHQRRKQPNVDMEDPTLIQYREAHISRSAPIVPCIRLYCKDELGYSVCVNTYGYYPVVHLLPSIVVSNTTVEEMREYVEQNLTENESKGTYPKKRPKEWEAILLARAVSGYPAFPYTEEPSSFIEFKLSDASYITAFGRLMRQNGGELESRLLGRVRIMPYSCQNIVDKFQADVGISGFGWIEVDRYTNSESSSFGDKSHCHFEIDTSLHCLKPIKAQDTIAPLRKITFDIECLKTRGMPDPENDAVIVISAICGDYINGQPTRKRKILLQLGHADPVKNIDAANGDVHMCFDKEVELLTAFGELVMLYDPDYLCGHNIIGFDLPYIVVRAKVIGAKAALFLGRRGAFKWTKPRRIVKKRKNGETRESKMTSTPGRIQLDTLNWIMNGFEKERSYKLAHLAAKYLKDTKDDVGYSMIGPMFRQSDATRSRLGKYCLKDSELTEGLCDLKRYQMVICSIEMSRQTRVPAPKLLRSGVQVKVWGLLLEKAKNPNFDAANNPVFFPDEEIHERDKDDKFAGAEVLEPFRGYYTDWVGCGDFRSLYPSLMIDLNICYTTEIRGDRYNGYPCKQSPIGVKFIDKKIRVGLLAQIEIELMAARDIAKRQAKESSDPGAANMYEKRQNEIKIICNSVYGILTASGGRLTRMELGESVTSQGRLMIITAKNITEALLSNIGHEMAAVANFKVIYGFVCHLSLLIKIIIEIRTLSSFFSPNGSKARKMRSSGSKSSARQSRNTSQTSK